MQVSLETTSVLERRLSIVVPAVDIDSKVEKRLKAMNQRVRLDGFRPGKVPFKVLKKRYGQRIYYEVLNEVMQRYSQDAIDSESLRPAGSPNIEPKNMKEGEDLEFTVTFEVYPEIVLEKFAQVTIKKLVSTVQDTDVDTMIKTLREQNVTWEEVEERVAENGDQVKIDFVGTLNDEVFEGGSANDQLLVLGAGQMIPGFEEGLIGSHVGEKRVLELTFPEAYHAEEMKGKQVNFAVTVNAISKPVLPEMNDEFFAQYAIKEGGEKAFREAIRKNMERELSKVITAKVKEQVMTGLLSIHTFDVPKTLINKEIDNLRQEAVVQFGGEKSNIDPKTLPVEMFRDKADRRVKLGLLISEIVKVNNLRLQEDDERVRRTIEEVASAYRQPQQVIDWYYSNEEQLSQVRYVVLEELVVDTVLDAAQVSEVECSYEEAVKPPQPIAENETGEHQVET
ncbi:MAG: trigger factor [Endozoicomonadaceae bacterium]|nr:trigger factor [Endozoicomonadaceae bacterium]